MTGWDLLEKLAERADNNPESLECDVWIGFDIGKNVTYGKANFIAHTMDTKSGEQGLFIKVQKGEKNVQT